MVRLTPTSILEFVPVTLFVVVGEEIILTLLFLAGEELLLLFNIHGERKFSFVSSNVEAEELLSFELVPAELSITNDRKSFFIIS